MSYEKYLTRVGCYIKSILQETMLTVLFQYQLDTCNPRNKTKITMKCYYKSEPEPETGNFIEIRLLFPVSDTLDRIDRFHGLRLLMEFKINK